jgi:hypothetical protein
MNTDTPRTEAARFEALRDSSFRWDCIPLKLGQELERELSASLENQCKAQAEVAKLNHQLLKAESDLLQSQDINSFLDTEFRIACKRAEKAETDVERLRAENVCLQELIQEFYEWSRRDYPTEAEVREIMNRYHDLLNK